MATDETKLNELSAPPPYNAQDMSPPILPINLSPPEYDARDSPAQQSPNPLYASAGAPPESVHVSVRPEGPSVIVIQQGVDPPPSPFLPGNCPVCRTGVLVNYYPCVAILLAIFLFPLGIVCCICMKEKRCTNCTFET